MAFALSVLWQAVLKVLNYVIGNPPELYTLYNQRRWTYYVNYLICTMMIGGCFIVFAGKEYFWAFYVLPVKATILYWLWFLFTELSHLPRIWPFAREIFFLGFTYLIAAFPCFVIFFSIPNAMTELTKNIMFFIGIMGISSICGAFLCMFTFALAALFITNYLKRYWTNSSFAYYFVYGLLLNYGFTKAIKHQEYEEYGYYTIILMLFFYISFWSSSRCSFDNGNDEADVYAFFGYLPVTSPFLFCSFWIWTKGFNNYDELSHFLYVAGLQSFTCLLSYLLGLLWKKIMEYITENLDINTNLNFNLPKLTEYIASFLFIILSLLIQMAIILLLQNPLYYYGLALAPFISILFLLLFIIHRKGLSRFLRDNTIISHYFTFIMIFTAFFIAFCVNQVLNPGDTFHLGFVLGILCWIPSILGVTIFVGIRYHFYGRLLAIMSVIILLLVILYIFISQYNEDSNKASYILYISTGIIFLPGLIYFLICTIIPRYTHHDCHLHNLNFGIGMKWQIWKICKSLKEHYVIYKYIYT